jgi:hypothetical protein
VVQAGAPGAAVRGQSFEGLKVASAAHEVNNFTESLTIVYLLQQNPRLDEDSRKGNFNTSSSSITQTVNP